MRDPGESAEFRNGRSNVATPRETLFFQDHGFCYGYLWVLGDRVEMPSPKRWFPKSRDFNDDPEGWELTDTFGDRTIRLWDEICTMLDKTDNHWRLSGEWLASLSRKVRQSSATVSRAIGWMVAKQWLVIDQLSADGSPMVYSSPNYWKYHKRQETKGEIPDSTAGSSKGPSLPYPILSEPLKKNLKKDSLALGFKKFWEAYPRKKSKGDAEKAWKALNPSPDLQTKIFQAIKVARGGADWLKERGKFIPYPASWLRAKGWEDEVDGEDDQGRVPTLEEVMKTDAERNEELYAEENKH